MPTTPGGQQFGVSTLHLVGLNTQSMLLRFDTLAIDMATPVVQDELRWQDQALTILEGSGPSPDVVECLRGSHRPTLPAPWGQVPVPVWLYIDRLLGLPLRPARITPRNSEASGSAVLSEDRTGGWCGDVHRLAELRERERGDRGHGSLESRRRLPGVCRREVTGR